MSLAWRKIPAQDQAEIERGTLATMPEKMQLPDFPIWLWIIIGAVIVALTAPLAVKIFQSGEFQHACTSGYRRRAVPLELQNWQMYAGYLAYINAFGWALITGAGVTLLFSRIREFSLAIGIVGFIAILITYSLVCQS